MSPGHDSSAATPSIGRSLSLVFLGDWGTANFHRICGWLCQELCGRAGSHSTVAIRNSHGQADSIRAVHRGEADLAVTTPIGAVAAALTGDGMYGGEPCPDLRALAVIPHRDMLLLAVGAEFEIRTFAELRQRRPALAIATSPDDGVSHLGYVARRFMETAGVSEEELERWGGRYVNMLRPDAMLELLGAGEVDGVLTEAIMTPWWRDAIERRQIALIPAEEETLSALHSRYGWAPRTLPANELPNQAEPIRSVDFSHFVVFVRSDMHDDVAHLLTWCLVETRAVLESQYRHLAPNRSPVSYPLEPEKMARTPFPLHPGAERYYREAGLL